MHCRRLILLILIFTLIKSDLIIGQKEADNWIFGQWAGLNFTTGEPVPWLPLNYDPNGGGFNHGMTMSNCNGNLLFYSSHNRVWNREGEIMPNGEGIIGELGWEQNYVAFPKPGFSDIYYLFHISSSESPIGLYYSVIDMNLDNGLGAVTLEKNVELVQAFWAHNKLFALRGLLPDTYWIISRLFNDDRFISFQIDLSGINPDPVYSSTGIYRAFNYGDNGYMKVSPDKKFLVAGYTNGGTTGVPNPLYSFDICKFDVKTGQITYKFMINDFNPEVGTYGFPTGCEFSPDSKFLYVTFIRGGNTNLYQFETRFIEDSINFINSRVLISDKASYSLQLANDGRIYCSSPENEIPDYEYVFGVISVPWKKGIDCNYIPDEVYLSGRLGSRWTPNILLDYLYRFEWEGENYCVGTPIHFLPHFVPTPVSIVWNFDEFAPGSTSNELSPTYAFKYAGVHEVSVDVWYPSGRYEHTSRELEIFPVPVPDLGADTLICPGSSLTLNADCDAGFFSWSTGQIGVSSIVVSDSGTYWVKARYIESGCEGYDTIHVGFYAPVYIDETNLSITPTTCDGANGKIAGLTVLGTPLFAFQWLDLSGNDYGTNIEATGLPAGQYQLTITDGNGCETVSEMYTIEDAGHLQVPEVERSRPHCDRPDGEIVVHAFSPAGLPLQYSINDGLTYQGDSLFTDLSDSVYVIRVTDEMGCYGFYEDNPVWLTDISGPLVTGLNITDETDFLGNGSIEIMASGSTSVIYYSIDSGATWQVNDGNFENLVCNMYYVLIRDDNSCDTAFTVEIQNIILTYLQAVTGEGAHCLGQTAMVPVQVENFTAVAGFHLRLSYNAYNLECEGFTHVHPLLADSLSGWVDPVAGDIHLTWDSPTAVTLTGAEKVADLVFTTKNPGQGELAWYTGETESYFTNAGGYHIPVEFSTGQVDIYQPPEILLAQSKTVCAGQLVSIMGIATGNQQPISYQWIYPNGDTTSNDPFFFSVTASNEGLYTLLATDGVGCTDEQSIGLIVSENPVAAFHGADTLEMHAGDVLDAGAGLSSYRWNTGDSTESIIINVEGIYNVEMESPIGCTGTDSVYVKLVSAEIPEFEIYVPNAFSPNGDGMNDVFKVIYKGLSIVNCQLSIFDRWGGEVYSAQGIDNGWDGRKNGKECPGGVYVYKIVFEVEGMAGSKERAGTVMLVR